MSDIQTEQTGPREVEPSAAANHRTPARSTGALGIGAVAFGAVALRGDGHRGTRHRASRHWRPGVETRASALADG